MDINELKDLVNDSDIILVGIGEEFECKEILNSSSRYLEVCNDIKKYALEWMLPLINHYFLKDYKPLSTALNNLLGILGDKNYFVITTSMNGFVRDAGFKEGKVVIPCGDYNKMQCSNKDCAKLLSTPKEFITEIEKYCAGEIKIDEISQIQCDECGEQMVFNSLFAENYNEEGYLPDWKNYTGFIQGTLNKKLLAIELGCSFLFPGIIRLPFEKTVFYNQKAKHIRIHESLYQTTADLGDRGIGIKSNSISFLV